jgi:sortase A
VVGGIGRVLVAAGVLVLLFVAYQLWGTGLSESHAQSTLGQEYRALTHSSPGTATAVGPGGALGIIQIPRIGLEKYLVQGTSEDDLQKGPGHYVNTPLPGQPGNVGIAGHRTTYGAPFYNLNQLAPGDPIYITTPAGRFRYDVTGSRVVAPSDVAVVAPTPGSRLTLTTCNPRFSATTRLVVSARLVGGTRLPAPAPTPVRSGPAPTNLTTGAGGAVPASIEWGVGTAAVWLLAWGLARRRRRLPFYLAATPVSLVLLFFFFENVTRILPASI